MGFWGWFSIGAGIIIAVVAAMIKPFLTKPKWRVSFDCTKGYKLWCWIRNIPITCRVLIWLGFSRKTQRINIEITLTDKNGNDMSPDSIYGVTSSCNDIRLGVVEIKSKGKVFLKDEQNRFGRELKVGLYTLELELRDDDRQRLKKKKHFRINSVYPFVEWMPK